MDIERHIDDRIGFVISGDNPVKSDNDIRIIKKAGFPVIVTVDDYNFNLSWKAGRDEIIRHYQYTFGEYPIAVNWELQHLNEFFLYEIEYGRNVAVWCKKPEIRKKIAESAEKFFRINDESLHELIHSKLESQAERAVGIPEKLKHCKACLERGCITRLVCHVSSVTDAERILKSGEILSASKVRMKTGEELSQESRNAAGDPPDYFDYVMFTFGNCTAGDNLVTERSLGRAPIRQEDLRRSFSPGVRFYFRYKDLVRHPGFRSDGYHYCKIRDSVSLDFPAFVIVAPESSRKIMSRAVPRGLERRLVFIDETEYPNSLSWSQQVCRVAETYS